MIFDDAGDDGRAFEFHYEVGVVQFVYGGSESGLPLFILVIDAVAVELWLLDLLLASLCGVRGVVLIEIVVTALHQRALLASSSSFASLPWVGSRISTLRPSVLSRSARASAAVRPIRL